MWFRKQLQHVANLLQDLSSQISCGSFLGVLSISDNLIMGWIICDVKVSPSFCHQICLLQG